jgi:hypothetical protein
VRKEIVRLRVFYETSMNDAGAEQDFRQRLAAAHARAAQQQASPAGGVRS